MPKNGTELEVEVTVKMNPLELNLFRRALAKAADDGLLDFTWALNRICALDVLRWNAEERAAKATKKRESKPAVKCGTALVTRKSGRARRAA
jgi:hypothetical protein